MKALVRLLLAAIGVLALLLVCGVIYVTTFLDPNDLKPRMVEAVKAQTGLDLTLNGPLDWSFYPHLGMSIQDASVRLPESDANASPLASVKSADVEVAFAPLLVGDVSIDGITVNGLKLDLKRDEQGRGNWVQVLDHMGESQGTLSNDKPKASRPVSPQNAASQPLGIDIARLNVNNGWIHYQDLESGAEYTLDKVMIEGSNIVPTQSFPLTMSFELASKAPEFTSEVSLKTQARADLAAKRYELSKLAVNSRTHYPALDGAHEQVLNASIERLVADTQASRYQLQGVTFDGESYLPGETEKALPFAASLSAEADLSQQTAALTDINVTGGDDLRLSGGLNVTGLLDSPSYNGTLTLAPFNVRQWLSDQLNVSLPSADKSALTKLAFSSPIKGDLNTLKLPDLDIALDDQDFSGEAELGLKGQRLMLALTGKRLDLDRYLAPPKGGADQASRSALIRSAMAEEKGAADASGVVPVELLKTLSLDLGVKLDQMTLKGMTLSDVALAVSGRNGQHTLDHLNANLYGGSAAFKGALNVLQSPIAWRLSEQIKGVQLKPLLADATQKPAKIQGALALEGTQTSRTNEFDSMLTNLNGRVDFHVTDGALLGQNLSKAMCGAVATLSGKQGTREWSEDTPFKTLQGTFKITNGVARNDDFELSIPGLRFDGAGEANLPTARFDYGLKGHFVNTADPDACRVSDKFQRVAFPVRCKGEFSGEPGSWCGVDRDALQASLGSLSVSEAKRKTQKELERGINDKVSEKFGSDTARELKNALDGLFN
ncbi:AsmA family protein [Larsenimonas salina]|uniref:AsmA family protein n=1 Tax=Larsenimonas salina TaxID=1295565 RepID=UPI002072F0BC|nr:AsmA family protein [Larsenimonas salina]MCM5705208.1 AsmA family protein [Larsenimonas salina]